MRIQIENCNVIDSGSIDIEPHKLNIKYAIYGTGKSTIAKAIQAKVTGNEDGLKQLLPFQYEGNADEHQPSISGLEDFHSIQIFNEDYVNQYVYQPDELIKDSFTIFVKTPDYDRNMAEITQLLESIGQTFQSHPERDQLIQTLNQFIVGFGKATQRGLSAASPLMKGLGKGNMIHHIPQGLESYAPYLQHTEGAKNVAWIKWQLSGRDYLEMADQCPYCSGSIETTREKITQISNVYDAKSIEHLDHLIEVYTALMPYLPEDARRQLQTILNNAANITDDQKHFLQAIKNDVDCLYQKLCDLKSIGFRNLKDVAQIESTLRNKKIDLPNYANLNSDLMRSKTNVLNTTIDGVLDRIIQLRIKISRQNTLIQNIISRNQKEINDFLRYAGYHYTVSIEEPEGKNYRLLLHYEDHREAINAVQTHLSYGERNALALLLFMYSIKRETPDLIILDDPISSFDGNKKFAIVNMLFKDPGHLKGKTVLLLTHEFGTVVDMVHTMKRNFGAVSTAAFLSTRNGVLQEQQIHAEDIKAYPAIAEKNIAESNDPLNKLIYLRRLMEFENNKNDAWQLLSNVFHVGDGTREVPMKCIGNGIEIPMTMDEIQKGTEDIKRYIPDFDYQMAYQRMEDRNLLISLYDSTEANYEKLQIYRLIFIERPMNVVVQKFVNETYHVENDYIFQLDPRIYDTVPQYIVDVCDQAINELRTVQPA